MSQTNSPSPGGGKTSFLDRAFRALSVAVAIVLCLFHLAAASPLVSPPCWVWPASEELP